MPQVLISDEIRKLTIKDCVKRLGDVKDCGIFISVYGSNKKPLYKTYIIAHCFATTENNKQKWLIVENSEILSKINLLYEKMSENWNEMFIICDIKANKFYTEFFNLYNPVKWDNITNYPKMLKYYKFKLKML